MKIIIVGSAYPYKGGLAAYNDRLAREYIRHGHDVEIYTFSMLYHSFLSSGKSQFSSESTPVDLKINRTINSINPASWIKTGLAIKKKSPDKIIFCYWIALSSPCFGTIARYARNPKSKIIAVVHSMSPENPNFFGKFMQRSFIKKMDGFVAMADSVISEINKYDKLLKPKVISPHPIYDHYGEVMPRDLAAMKLGLNRQDSYILFFGFIRQNKGLDLLLEAFADERLRKYPVKLIIAGEFYENPEPYLKLISKLKLGNHIELRTKFISDQDVRTYFSLADIVAQPYKSATQSGVIQVAYHFEKPILVTNVGGLAESVPNGKVGYVTTLEPIQIANSLVDFFENQRAEKMIENIRTEKKKYKWSYMTDAINEI